MFRSKLGSGSGSGLGLGLLLIVSVCVTVESKCSRGCDLALGSYYILPESNLTFVSEVSNDSISDILSYNPQFPNQESVKSDVRINIPFSCDCINGEFLAHVLKYTVRPIDTYETVAGKEYANLTTTEWLQRFNTYDPNRIPDGAQLNVTVNCSCGDSSVSKAYGLFITYPLRLGESLESIVAETNLSADLLRSYNPNANFSAGSGLVYIPGKDKSGNYPPLNSRRNSVQDKSARSDDQSRQAARAHRSTLEKAKDNTGVHGAASVGLTGISVGKSVEFSYKELAKATNGFNITNKIGEGGFGSVFYAELRGEKAAIKKMNMRVSKEFLAELKVLTHVNHLNLVRLIGYCVNGSLFLVCEYIENGNLSEHLHGGRDTLPWSTRVQIALDSGRGLEYIHEHTVPVYIHRDIKSANILLGKNFCGKVADFGLAKLTEVGSTLQPSCLVGTFGHMPPEYAHHGYVSPKVDVYAFGVALYELISAKEAVVKASDSMDEPKTLVGLFDEVLCQPDPSEDLLKLVDPRLEDNYPFDSIRKMAQLAKACTQNNSQLRPSMRSIVVVLMTLSSSTEVWDVDSFYENPDLVNLMSGRVASLRESGTPDVVFKSTR